MSPIRFKFDAEKALEVILYVASNAHIPDVYHVLKILYFADKNHLEENGRFIFGDSYVAMAHGPVPSGAYDIIKYVRNSSSLISLEHAKASFEVSPDHTIQPLRPPDLDLLSKTEIKCLDDSMRENGALTFAELKMKSHDAAFKSADVNDVISVEAIASTLADGNLIIEHLQDQ